MGRWSLVFFLVLGSILWLGSAQDSAPTPDQQETYPSSPEAQEENREAEDTEAEEQKEGNESEPPSEEAPGDEAADEEIAEDEPSPAPLLEEEATEDIVPVSQRSIPEGAKARGNLTLRREDRTIIVNQYAQKAEGGEFVLNAPDCGDEAKEKGLRTHTVYGGDAFWVETLVNDTRITSAIALVRKPDEGKEQEVLELFGGALEVSSETKCPENLQLSDLQDVRLVQGRTTVDGYRFDYDNKTGIGKMKGPVKLDRIAEGESPALIADANELEYNEESDETKLTGEVTIESDGRISRADSVDFDDANSIAVLRGSPATSEKDGDLFQGSVIRYFLDSNDVRVEGNIQGELEVDLGENTTTTTTEQDSAGEEGFGTGEEGFNPDDPTPEEFEDEFNNEF